MTLSSLNMQEMYYVGKVQKHLCLIYLKKLQYFQVLWLILLETVAMHISQENRNYLTRRNIEHVYQYGTKTGMAKLIDKSIQWCSVVVLILTSSIM